MQALQEWDFDIRNIAPATIPLRQETKLGVFVGMNIYLVWIIGTDEVHDTIYILALYQLLYVRPHREVAEGVQGFLEIICILDTHISCR